MQVTPTTKEYVRMIVKRACNVMDINMPAVVFTWEEWNILGGHATRKGLSKVFGCCVKDCHSANGMIYINIKLCGNVHTMNDTIVHELYHLKNWKAKHSISFDNKVKFYMDCLFDYGNLEKKYTQNKDKTIFYKTSTL